jgi:glycosyltransferase involved in cell wall biosynthesis/SAM-dependent methyltransferase
LGYFLLAIRLFVWFRRHKPDVIFTHGHYANVLGQLLGAVAGVRKRIAVQHCIPTGYPAFPRFADWLFGTVGIYTTQIAVSHSVVESMLAYPENYKKNIHMIYNGIELAPNDCSSSQQLAELPVGRPRILHVGRLSREKNHEALLKSLQQIPGAYLVLVGDGELRGTLEQQVQTMGLVDRVCFLGEITPEEVRAVMNVCDLFMFPSVFEALGLALIEAMAAGMPIVASDIPACREVLQDTGILVSPTPQELSQAAKRLLADSTYAKEMGRKAAERAKNFSVDAMVDGYESLFLSQTHSHKRLFRNLWGHLDWTRNKSLQTRQRMKILSRQESQNGNSSSNLKTDVEGNRAARRLKAILAIAGELGISLSPQSRILDFGCGLGYYTLALREMGFLSYGCDVWDRCQPAAKACRTMTTEQVFSIAPLDKYALPFPDGHFDFIFSDHVMEHVLDYDSVLRETRRVLRPGGVALHIFPSRYRVLESHLKVPFGGCLTGRRWFALWARFGVGRAGHGAIPADEVARRNTEWVSTRLNYLPKCDIRKACSKHFNTVRFAEGAALAAVGHLRLPLLAHLISTFHVRVLLLA